MHAPPGRERPCRGCRLRSGSEASSASVRCASAHRTAASLVRCPRRHTAGGLTEPHRHVLPARFAPAPCENRSCARAVESPHHHTPMQPRRLVLVPALARPRTAPLHGPFDIFFVRPSEALQANPRRCVVHAARHPVCACGARHQGDMPVWTLSIQQMFVLHARACVGHSQTTAATASPTDRLLSAPATVRYIVVYHERTRAGGEPLCSISTVPCLLPVTAGRRHHWLAILCARLVRNVQNTAWATSPAAERHAALLSRKGHL